MPYFLGKRQIFLCQSFENILDQKAVKVAAVRA